jgi:hypothetical protein
MTLASIILFVGIGFAIGVAVCAIRAEAAGIARCESCEMLNADADRMLAECEGVEDAGAESTLPPRVTRAIRPDAKRRFGEAADAIPQTGNCQPSTDNLLAGTCVWIDLDIIEHLETGGLPSEKDRDEAVGRAGERGRYQITAAAWRDAMDWLKSRRGYKVSWLFEARAHDGGYARVIAGTYLNEVLPRQLTCARLDAHDRTGPVPDSWYARVAAYNAGARRVREAYAAWKAEEGTALPWTAFLPEPTIAYLARYAAAADKVAGIR